MKLGDLTAQNETISPLHPSLGEVEGLTFTVCSPFSREYNRNTARIHSELFSDEFDQGDAWQIFQAEAIMVGWSGIEDDDGKPVEFTKEECSKVFRNPDFAWMVAAVNEHLSKKKGYLQTITRRLDDTLKSMDTLPPSQKKKKGRG